MRPFEAQSAAGLLAMLSLVAGCSRGAPPTPAAAALATAQPQKEADTVKTSAKHPPASQGGLPGSPQSGPGAGLPDTGPGKALSPLAAEAIALAKSKADPDHTRLASMLVDKAWLDRLDPPRAAAGIDPRFLQLTPVLEAAAGYAPQTLEGPASSDLYRKSDYRRASLVVASGAAAKPGPKLVQLWRSQLDPEAELDATIRALVSSGSDAALQLLADAFASDAFDTELVISWFRDPVLRHRQDPQLLAALDRLLQGGKLNAKRRFALVEALFEYRPKDWYAPSEPPPAPPKRADLTNVARASLRAIADRAVRDGLIDSARRARIETELAPPPPTPPATR
jgi:hypothetical protein